jgi:hypothetical protein
LNGTVTHCFTKKQRKVIFTYDLLVLREMILMMERTIQMASLSVSAHNFNNLSRLSGREKTLNMEGIAYESISYHFS